MIRNPSFKIGHDHSNVTAKNRFAADKSREVLIAKCERSDNMSEGGNTLEAYQYLGLSTVVVRSQPESGIELTYLQQEGDGDAITSGAAFGGDQYTGLDRFGRVAKGGIWAIGVNGSV